MDKYSIIRRIGKGSQGLVYLAKNKETSETVAIKQIVCATKEIVEKVMKEINLVLQFDHPNIIKYYDIFTTETTDEFTHDTTYQVYVVMEYCKTTLQRELDKRVKEQKPFDSKILERWILQFVKSLQYLHGMNIIHRDIKPDNMLIKTTDDQSGADWELKLSDFGFVKQMTGDSKTGSFVGTILYMAPEIRSKQMYSFEADIFSLGVVVYQLLTLKPASELESVTDKLEKNPHYVKEMLKDFKDTPLTEVVEKCLKLDPKERGNLSDIEIILTKVHRDDNTLDDEMHTPVGQNSFDVLKIFNYFRTRRRHKKTKSFNSIPPLDLKQPIDANIDSNQLKVSNSTYTKTPITPRSQSVSRVNNNKTTPPGSRSNSLQTPIFSVQTKVTCTNNPQEKTLKKSYTMKTQPRPIQTPLKQKSSSFGDKFQIKEEKKRNWMENMVGSPPKERWSFNGYALANKYNKDQQGLPYPYDELNETILVELVKKIQNKDTGFVCSTRTFHCVTYKNCFVGLYHSNGAIINCSPANEAIDWLIKNEPKLVRYLTMDRTGAKALCQFLVDIGVCEHVAHPHKKFEDTFLLFRFNEVSDKELCERFKDLKSAITQISTREKVLNIIKSLMDPEKGVELKERSRFFRTFSNSFVGSEAVQWFVNNLKISRRSAVKVGEMLREIKAIEHVTNSQVFCDAKYYYRVTDVVANEIALSVQ